MQPIARPAVRCVGPEQDVKRLNRKQKIRGIIERPAFVLAFLFWVAGVGACALTSFRISYKLLHKSTFVSSSCHEKCPVPSARESRNGDQ